MMLDDVAAVETVARPAHDIERNGLVGIAAETSDLKIAVTSVERVAERRRGLGWLLVTEHALVPGFTCEPISLLARLGRPPADARIELP
jgi:hypothetical protein